MTKTLGSAAPQLYAGIAAMFLPIENQPRLIADLEGDSFFGHALSSATCELYHRYGMFLAPLTSALTTLKHCQFGHCCPGRVHDGGQLSEPVASACWRLIGLPTVSSLPYTTAPGLLEGAHSRREAGVWRLQQR